MSLRVVLLRHAKSSWDGNEEDHERPLTKRGRRSADAIGCWLEERMPEQVLCSDAVRTQETWARVAGADGPEAQLVPELYLASCDVILRVLRRAEAPHVAIVGHNPGLGTFASRIVARRPDHPSFGDYPTGAITIVSFAAARWSEVGWHDGIVDAFVVPRDL